VIDRLEAYLLRYDRAAPNRRAWSIMVSNSQR